MIRVGAPVAATAPTARSTSSVVTRGQRLSVARWMTGPSITGSEYGRPTSTMSTPPSIMARMASIEPSTTGSRPAGSR